MTVDSFEVARAELVEGLARMVNRVIQHGKAKAQSALGSIEQIRTTLAGITKLDDYLDDLDAAERVLLQSGNGRRSRDERPVGNSGSRVPT